jgi:hypothetical protein
MTRGATGGPRQRRRRLLTLAVVLGASVSLLPRGSSATVEEQRARLPPPAECADPVEGTWAGLVYTAPQRTWYEYTLVIRRTAPATAGNLAGALEGEMLSHYWTGNPSADKPPTGCTPGQREVTVKMPGTGTVDAAANVSFGSTSYAIDHVTCGIPAPYLPDHFSGTIDSTIHEFQSVNNDGGSAVNEPAVFRRIRCRDAPGRTRSTAKPPALAPPKHAWKCSR